MRSVLGSLAVIAMTVAAGIAAADSSNRTNQPACFDELAGGVPPARLSALARGFNLPGWLDGPAPRRPDFAVLAELKARGFTHIRLPVGLETVSGAFSTPGGVTRQLAELDFAVDTITRLGFAVSIDMHPGERFNRLHRDRPDEALSILEQVWRALGRRYATRSPQRVFFETLNEPVVSDRIWKEQGPRLVAAIRGEAPDHTIIYGHADYERIDALAAVSPVADLNIVYAAHFYDPMIFTHQGLDWSDSPLRYLRQVPFPARLDDPAVTGLIDDLTALDHPDAAAAVKDALREPWTEQRLETEIAAAGAWAKLNRRPVIINEFGVLGWKAPPADRVRWLSTVRRAAERNCLGWAHWDYADAFGFVRRVGGREIPDEAIMHALLGPRGILPTIH